MSRNKVWMVDGHNVLFAIHALKGLQVGGRGEEARRVLAERLEAFAIERQERVVLVFDGGARATARDGGRGALLEIVYAHGGPGAADRHILREAARRAGEGLTITVVTDDVQTLARRLPPSVRHVGVRSFWRGHVEPRTPSGEKPVAGDFVDIERALLALEAAGDREGGTVSSRERPGAARPPASRPVDAEVAAEGAAERLRAKRERGRWRQERRLERREGRGGRGRRR